MNPRLSPEVAGRTQFGGIIGRVSIASARPSTPSALAGLRLPLHCQAASPRRGAGFQRSLFALWRRLTRLACLLVDEPSAGHAQTRQNHDRICGVSEAMRDRRSRTPRLRQSTPWKCEHSHTTSWANVDSAAMEPFPVPLFVAGAFLAGVLVGYVVRAFISARHRARARHRRHDFEPS